MGRRNRGRMSGTVLQVRCSNAEYEQLEGAALRDETKITNWSRRILLGAALTPELARQLLEAGARFELADPPPVVPGKDQP